MSTKSQENVNEEKIQIVADIVRDLLGVYKSNILKLTNEKKITTMDNLRPFVSATAMSFFMTVIHHLLETMDMNMQVDFLMFMRKQSQDAIDKLIEEAKENKREQ